MSAKLTPSELRRRLFHMSPGGLAILFSQVPHQHPLSRFDLISLSSIVIVLAVVTRLMYSAIARKGETTWTLNIVWYLLPVASLLFVFPKHPEFAAVCMVVVSFGDGTATVFGLLFGRHPLPWNSQKSWAGFVGFLVCSLPPAILAYWLEALPKVPLREAVFCGTSAAICGQIAESLPSSSSDNLRVGVAAAAGVVLAYLSMFGPSLL